MVAYACPFELAVEDCTDFERRMFHFDVWRAMGDKVGTLRRWTLARFRGQRLTGNRSLIQGWLLEAASGERIVATDEEWETVSWSSTASAGIPYPDRARRRTRALHSSPHERRSEIFRPHETLVPRASTTPLRPQEPARVVFRQPVSRRETVRRQNIWHNSRRSLAECGPRLGLMFRRRACGVASADIGVSVA